MIAFFLIAAGLFVLLLLIELLAEWHDLRRYPSPGRMVDVNSKRLHVVEQRSEGLTVILEAGLAATSLSWVFTPPLLAKFAQVIAYDRAGLGRSSPSKKPLALVDLLADLDGLTRTLQVSDPFILVGHSFGGLLVRAFAHLHPERVAGLVLVDPVSLGTYANPDRHHLKRLALGARLSRRGAWLARLAVVRSVLWMVARGSRKLPSLIGRISAGKGSSVMDRLANEIAKLPPETHGPIRAHWSKPASFSLMAEYLQFLPAAASQALAMGVPAHIPVIVLSAATATAFELAEREEWTRDNPRSRHAQIPGTTHWLQLDRPDVVAGAVEELIRWS